MKLGRICRLVVAAGLVAGISCSDAIGPAEGGGELVALTVGANVAGTPIATIAVTVTASGIATPLVFNLQVANGIASGNIVVRAGAARTFTARAFDDEGAETHSGQTTMDVRPGTNPALELVLLPRGGNVPVVITIASVAVSVSPASASIVAGETIQLEARVTDGNGEPLDLAVYWATSNAAIATVTSGGLVAGVIAGDAQIVAVVAGVAGMATIHVAPPETGGIISVPTTLNVPYGLAASIPLQLSVPAPAGGLTVMLSTSDATRVGLVTQTVSFSAGSQFQNGTVSGVSPGTASVTATAPGWTTATSTVSTTADLDIVQGSITIDPVFPGTITIEFESGGVPRAAPAGGITVTLTPADPSCAAVTSPVTIAAGQVNATADVSYGGSASLPCNTSITATSANLTSSTVNVLVRTTPAISLSAIPNLGSGLQLSVRSGTLSTAAPAGGITVHLVSSDEKKLLLARNENEKGQATLDISVAGGAASFTYTVQALENVSDVVTVTASAPQYLDGTVTVTIVTPVLQLTGLNTAYSTLDGAAPFQVSVGVGTGTQITATQKVRIGALVLTATISNSESGAAELLTTSGSGQSVTVFIAPGQFTSPSTVVAGGVALRPLGEGTTTIAATIPGFTATTNASQTISLNAPAIILQTSTIVGSGLQLAGRTVTLAAPAPAGGLTVHLASSDPTKLLLAKNATTQGAVSFDTTMKAGTTTFTYTVQALENVTDAVTITASAPLYASASVTANVVKPVLQLGNLNTSYSTLAGAAAFQVSVGIGTTTQISTNQAVRIGAPALTATITNSNATVAQLVTTAATGQSVTVSISPGQFNSASTVLAGGVGFDPLSAGSTTVAATIPGFTATTFASRTVNVTAPAITLATVGNVGRGLQMSTASGSLSSPAPAGGLVVRLVSSDPLRVLLAPNAISGGAGSINISVSAGVSSFTYTVQALENATESATITASATAYTSGMVTATVVAPSVDIFNLSATTTTISGTAPFIVRVGVGAASVTMTQSVRTGGTALTATVTSSSPSVGLLATTPLTAQSVTVTINPGQNSSPSSLATGGVGFQPVSAGNTIVAASIPGFTSTAFASRAITVSAPVITLNAMADVGSGLQLSNAAGTLSAPAPAGTIVRLVSSDSRVRIASSEMEAGDPTLDIPLAAGATSFTYTVQALENFTGTVTITASASGYVDGSTPVSVVVPVFQLSSLNASYSLSAADPHFRVTIGVGTTDGITMNQAVRVRGSPLTATITNGDPLVAQLAAAAGSGQSVTVIIDAGQFESPATVATGGVAFSPLAPGTTTVAAVIPGLTPTATASRTVTVTP